MRGQLAIKTGATAAASLSMVFSVIAAGIVSGVNGMDGSLSVEASNLYGLEVAGNFNREGVRIRVAVYPVR